jgi:hypothetical protein
MTTNTYDQITYNLQNEVFVQINNDVYYFTITDSTAAYAAIRIARRLGGRKGLAYLKSVASEALTTNMLKGRNEMKKF